MTVNELANALLLKTHACPDPDREISGVYIGDLLSWVMGRAQSGEAWITIMSNINIVAVASLVDSSCVLLAEGVEPDQNLISTAEAKGVNLFTSDQTAYELAKALAELLR
jgi:hypothetical protein